MLLCYTSSMQSLQQPAAWPAKLKMFTIWPFPPAIPKVRPLESGPQAHPAHCSTVTAADCKTKVCRWGKGGIAFQPNPYTLTILLLISWK